MEYIQHDPVTFSSLFGCIACLSAIDGGQKREPSPPPFSDGAFSSCERKYIKGNTTSLRVWLNDERLPRVSGLHEKKKVARTTTIHSELAVRNSMG